MAKLPRYSSTTIPRGSGMVRASDIGSLTRTSDQAVYSGLGAFGRGLSVASDLAFKASQNRQALDDEIEGGIFTQKAQARFNLANDEAALYDFTTNLPQPGDKDYYTTVENYSTEQRDKLTADNIGRTTKDIEELISNIKSPRVRANAEVWFSKNIEQKSDSIRHTYGVNHENWQITQMTKMMETAAENGDLETANRLASKMDEFNLITPQKAEVLKKNNEEIRIQALINLDPESAMQAIDTSTIGEKQKNILRSQARTAIARKQTEAKLIQKQIDDRYGDTFLALLDNKLEPTKPQLSFDMINNAREMSFDAKTAWFTRLMTFDNYSESELKEAFTDKGEVLAEIYDKIDAGILIDELDTMVGKGLSPTTAQRLKKEVREPYKKDTDQLFKRIFGWSPELGFENDLSSFLYEKTLREWESEIKRQDATGEKIVEIGRSIARPYFIEHLKKTMAGQEADISRMVELALGEELQKTEPEVKPKEDEGPRTYQDFEDEVARLKKIDMGKAKAFYDAWIEKFTE